MSEDYDYDSIEVRLMGLDKFECVRTVIVKTKDEALRVVKEYCEPHGFTNVKCIDDDDGWRFTAKTPGGRSGRNVAFAM